MKKLYCKLFFHDLVVVKTSDGGNVQKVLCKRCDRYFGMNHSVKAFLPWDSELENLMKIVCSNY